MGKLLGICFWRKGREERNWVEFMGEKGGCAAANSVLNVPALSATLTMLSAAFAEPQTAIRHIASSTGCRHVFLKFFMGIPFDE